MKLQPEDFQTVVRSQGVVRAETDAVISSEVSGKIVEISPSLQDGAFFEKGDVLVRLSAEDFESAIISAQANLARAESAHAQEKTKAKQARLNWEDLGYKEEPNELVLRLPQVREAEANVLAAKAALAAAERDLTRADVRAPFAGRVLTRSVAIGQRVTPSVVLATVFDTSRVEVRLPITPRYLAFVDLPETADDPPVPVHLEDALTEDSPTSWSGQIVGTEGALNPDSRELIVIARIDDPFLRNAQIEGQSSASKPLRIGQPVSAEIRARVLRGVLAIPRSAVRNLRFINLVDPETMTLSRREIDPVWSDETHLIIEAEGIPSGALLSTTRLVFAPEGGNVEIIEPSAEADEPETISAAD